MLYDIAFFIFSLFYLPTLLFKGRLHGDFLERFARYDKETLAFLNSRPKKIWIQAVSVGEVALCKGLIKSLREKFPKKPIVLSTITKAGNDLANKLFSGSAAVIYFPLDFSFIARKAIRIIEPGLYIMVETEIWPNLLAGLRSASVPSIVVNGRISDRSFGKYVLAKPFMRNILGKIDLFCMQSELDAERIRSLGAPEARVCFTCNMKFDMEGMKREVTLEEIRRSLDLNASDRLFVAGSTHNGEEEVLMNVFKELVGEFPNLKLLIAPRHIDRVQEVEKIVKKAGFEVRRVSLMNSQLPAPSSRLVLILDTIGKLNDVYSIATLVFIGGSLVKYGGHNPIEPAIFEKPILFGPHMFNFKNIETLFLKNAAAIRIGGRQELFDKCRMLLKDEKARLRLGANAKEVVVKNSGATKRNLEEIEKLLT